MYILILLLGIFIVTYLLHLFIQLIKMSSVFDEYARVFQHLYSE